MDRKGFIILFITISTVLGWHFGYYEPWRKEHVRQLIEADKSKKAAAAAKAEEEADAAKVAGTAGIEKAGDPQASAAGPAATPVVPAPEAKPLVEEQIVAVKSPAQTVDYKFSNLGGGISRAILLKHRGEGTARMVLNDLGSIPIGSITTKPGDKNELQLPWTMAVDEASGTVTFEQVNAIEHLKITKTFSLPKNTELENEYTVQLKVDFENLGSKPVTMPEYYVHTGSIAPIHQSDQRLYIGFDWMSQGTNTFNDIDWFSEGGFLMWKHEARPVFSQRANDVTWASVVNQYFTTMVTVLTDEKLPPQDRQKFRGVGVWATRTDIPEAQWREGGHSAGGKEPLQRVDSALTMPGFSVAQGVTETKHFQIYAGPREYRRLRLLPNNESDVMSYGSFLGIPTGPFSKLLLNALNLFYSWIGSYAISIVLLTILVKAILWPLQDRATQQMKKMALLQPQIKILQEKYKSDGMKLQQEMGLLWKQYGVNPLNGCWPMLVQIPIFVGFYNMLGKAVELRDHGFLWVKDLASPDTIFHIASIPVNPLPLCMAGTMFLQMKMSPQTGDPAQRKMLMFMPLIFVFFCYNFASALALYWTVQNIISIVQLVLTKNQAPPTLEKVTVIPPKKRKR